MESKEAKKLLAQYIDCRNKGIADSAKTIEEKKFIAKHLKSSKSYGEGNIGLSNNGFHNSGACNKGAGNSGDWNIGEYNSGYQNIGDYNAGRFNAGNYNAGECNVGNHNAGIFNTGEPNMKAFNKETNIKCSEWRKSKDYIDFYDLSMVDFVPIKDMTQAEKARHPEYKTMSGYIKKVGTKVAWARWWKKNKSQEMIEKIKKLPNFDSKIFKEITGIEIS